MDNPITELLVVDPETGEILSCNGQPGPDAAVAEQLEWLAEKRTQVAADLAGVLAEKAYWEDRIREQYDPEINRLKATLAWLVSEKTPWYAGIRAWAEPIIKAGKTASLKTGLLTLRVKRSRESLEVTDEIAAIQWATVVCPDAVAVKRSLLKSAVPEQLRPQLPESSGMVWHPSGETEEFVIE